MFLILKKPLISPLILFTLFFPIIFNELIGNLLKIIGFTLIGFSFFEYIYTFIMIIPATLIGSRIGQIFLNRISNKFFTIIFQFILVALAIRLLIM